MVAAMASTGRSPTALRPFALKWLPSSSVGWLPARPCPGVRHAKAKASGRVDVYIRGSQGSVCLSTPIVGLSRSGYLGFVLGLAYGIAYGFALGLTYHECDKRPLRLTTNGSTRQHAQTPGCSLWLSVGVRTGGRLHPGLTGERLLKQRPKLFVYLFRRPRSCWGLREDEFGFWLGVRGYVLRFEVCCVPDCLPALPLLGLLSVAFAYLVCSRFFRTCSLPYCVPADLGGVAPCALVGLGPPAHSVAESGRAI